MFMNLDDSRSTIHDPRLKKGCLVVHGLTGTPATVSVVSQKLLDSGFRVSSPCLAGHGDSVKTLSKSTWEEWYETVRFAYRQMRKDVDRLYYVGASLGALLGLKLAIDEGWNVKGLALVGTPLKLSGINRFFSAAVKNTLLKYVVKSVKCNLNESIASPEGRSEYAQYSLPRFPASAVFEIQKLQKIVLGDLSKVVNPLMMLHSKVDKIAPYENVSMLKNCVSSDVVEEWIAKKSRHVITMDYDKADAAAVIANFFSRI